MDWEEIRVVLQECADFVGVFGSDRADELLPRIHAARDAVLDKHAEEEFEEQGWWGPKGN